MLMLVRPVGQGGNPGRSHRWADAKHRPGAGCETCCWSGQRGLLRVSFSEKGRGQFRATSFLYFLRQMDRIQIDKREGLVSSCFSFTSSWLVRWWTPDHCPCCGFSFLSSSGLAFSVKLPCCWSPRRQPPSPPPSVLEGRHKDAQLLWGRPVSTPLWYCRWLPLCSSASCLSVRLNG